MGLNTILLLTYSVDWSRANEIASSLSKKGYTIRMEHPDAFDFEQKEQSHLL